jgi:hypothetical protein
MENVFLDESHRYGHYGLWNIVMQLCDKPETSMKISGR